MTPGAMTANGPRSKISLRDSAPAVIFVMSTCRWLQLKAVVFHPLDATEEPVAFCHGSAVLPGGHVFAVVPTHDSLSRGHG